MQPNRTQVEFAKRGQTLTLAQEFNETKDWFVQHKRDPFLWLMILGPLMFAALRIWGVVAFPPSDAIRAVRQILPIGDMSMEPKNFPNCGAKKYVFGYDFGFKTDAGQYGGRVCRDVVNGGWVLQIDKAP